MNCGSGSVSLGLPSLGVEAGGPGTPRGGASMMAPAEPVAGAAWPSMQHTRNPSDRLFAPPVRDTSPSPGLSYLADRTDYLGPTSSGHLAPTSSGQMNFGQRPQDDWERQMDKVDQQEIEMYQTQLRLIREQTATFRGDLLALRQEVTDLKVHVGKQVEGRMQELADVISGHTQLHQEDDRKFSQLADNQQNHQRTLQAHDAAHAAMKERLEQLEKFCGDSLDHHRRQIEETFSRMEKGDKILEDKIHDVEKNRLEYMEKVVGDLAERTAKELSTLKTTHGTHNASIREVATKHVDLHQRIDGLEKALGDSHDQHHKSVASQQVKLEQLHGKMTEHERERAKHTDHISATNDKMSQHHDTIEERLAYIEKAVGDSFQSHAQEIEQIKGAHMKMQGEGRDSKVKHSSMEERIDYIETWFKGFKAPQVSASDGSASLRTRGPML